MHPVFLKNWISEKKHFEYQYDWHWNERGHKLTAEAIDESGFLVNQ